jgi:hypothetical protein
VALPDLLRAHHFTQHPFAAWRAEDEERDLASWFIQPPFFDDILGNLGTPRQAMKPTSHLVFGTPGGGKTALRKMVEAKLTESPALMVIRYTDFTRVLSGEIARPSLSQHVDELLRLGTISLLAMWYESRDRYEALNISQRAELAGLVMEYYEVCCLSWKWRKRSSVKITERTHEETTEALHTGRESRHSEEAFGGRSADLGPV